jgi:hypothetical protein|tara:strand:- start:769 stop:1035 length:267 start_codon:yes stop_codon:yes gene_type:complete
MACIHFVYSDEHDSKQSFRERRSNVLSCFSVEILGQPLPFTLATSFVFSNLLKNLEMVDLWKLISVCSMAKVKSVFQCHFEKQTFYKS